MIWPELTDDKIIAIIIGVITAPLLVADVPTTPWMKSGRNTVDPNIASATSVAATDVVAIVRFLKRLGGMMGSFARISTTRNATVSRAPPPSSDAICHESHA